MNKIIHNRLSTAAIIAVVALAISIPAVSFSQGKGDRGKAAVAATNSKPTGPRRLVFFGGWFCPTVKSCLRV